MVQIQTYSFKNILLTNEVLGSYINRFWEDIFTKIKDTKHLMIMCKVEFDDTEEIVGYRTLGHLRRVNYSDKDLFIEYLTARLGVLTDSYTTHPISNIIFSYIIKDGLAIDNRKLLQDLDLKTSTTHRFNNMNLPITMNPEEYGIIELSNQIIENSNSFIRYIITNGNKTFKIDVHENINIVTMLGAIDLTWTDTKISDDIFKREIGKSIIYFMGGEKILTKKRLIAKPFKKLSVEHNLNNNFVTMDIETILDQSKITPYLICAYNGIKYITSYAQYSFVNGQLVINQKELFNSFINQLLTFFNKNNTLTVYAHNFSSFDGIFLLKHLFAFGKVEPILFNGKLMSIKIKLNIEGYKGKTIIFKDSYLLLPLSLRNLCSAFNVTEPKGYFPFKLKDIFYKGLLPKFEYWIGISYKDFESLIKEYFGIIWNYRDEAIKYCKLDCKCLYDILVNFNNLIFNEFKLNINNSLTLPALAMKIYKSQYMPENTVYQLLGNIEKDIRQSYTGGAVDVYIPHNRIRSFFSRFLTKLFVYDVNSLYPFIMSNTFMPIGKPIAFIGNIRKVEHDAFGFFYCKITSPKYLEHPLLQRRIKTSEGIRTIAGLGNWEGWVYSAEMDNAIKYGYTFEIIKGYQFNKGNIFKDYIEKMYELRLEYPKGHPMNLIAKLLMNSLYGKFGMKPESTVIEIFDTANENELELFKDMLDIYGNSLVDYINIDNFYITLRNNVSNYQYNEQEDMYHGIDVNIAIASAITGGARMWMSILKNNPLFKLFYSDTDSAVVDRPLPDELVGNKLGQFKLEHVVTKAIFLAPKVYGLVTESGEEIIKIKGIKNEVLKDIHMKDLEDLMHKDSSREFNQEKWLKKVIEGNICVKDIVYTLKVTSNKRKSIYVNNIFENTEPFHYDEITNKND
jgi:DNA polymerase type B, organellar and viral